MAARGGPPRVTSTWIGWRFSRATSAAFSLADQLTTSQSYYHAITPRDDTQVPGSTCECINESMDSWIYCEISNLCQLHMKCLQSPRERSAGTRAAHAYSLALKCYEFHLFITTIQQFAPKWKGRYASESSILLDGMEKEMLNMTWQICRSFRPLATECRCNGICLSG